MVKNKRLKIKMELREVSALKLQILLYVVNFKYMDLNGMPSAL